MQFYTRDAVLFGKPFLEALALHRRSEGLTQEDLARVLGVSRQYVSMIERGRRPFPLWLAVPWGAVVGLTAADMLTCVLSEFHRRDLLVQTDVRALRANMWGVRLSGRRRTHRSTGARSKPSEYGAAAPEVCQTCALRHPGPSS